MHNDETKSRPRDLVAGIIVAAIGAGIVIESLRMPHPITSFDAPGFVPLLLGVALTMMGLRITWSHRQANLGGHKGTPGDRGLGATRHRVSHAGWRMGAVVSMMIAYAVVLPLVGYVVSTFMMLAIFQIAFLESRKPRWIAIALAVALVISMSIGWLFEEVFRVPLP